MTAFLFYSMDVRPSIVEEVPKVPFGEIGKRVGAKWKALTDEQKQPYQRKAAADKLRFERDVAAGVDENGNPYGKKPKLAKTKSKKKQQQEEAEDDEEEIYSTDYEGERALYYPAVC
jgi:high mobility group protein B1